MIHSADNVHLSASIPGLVSKVNPQRRNEAIWKMRMCGKCLLTRAIRVLQGHFGHPRRGKILGGAWVPAQRQTHAKGLGGDGARLDGRSQGDPDGEVHLVLGRHEHGGDVLAGVAGDGQHDEAQEGAADARLLAHLLDAARQKLCTQIEKIREL